MWRTSKEEWERRKSYLIRSLFEDLPILSPIYESQEPTQSSSENDIYRPESPLPELIIEKELPREKKYHQDESEEFYDKLEREMRKLYKRDFLHVEEDSSSSSDEGFEIENETYTQEDSNLDEDRSLDAEELDNGDNSVEEEENYDSEISKEEESQQTITISPNNDSTESEVTCTHEEITTEVQVHRSYEEMSVQPMQDINDASEGGFDPLNLTKITEISFSLKENEHNFMENDSETVREEEGGPTEQESLAKTIEASPKSPDDYQMMTDMTPEIMRHHQTEPSDDMLPHHEIPIRESDNNSSESIRMEVENTFSIEKFIASGLETEIADASFSDSNILFTVTSTPKSSRVRRSKMINKHTSRLVPYSLSSSSSIQEWESQRQMALQTSFSDDEPDLRDLWNNFFVGTPTVYNICSCSNHVCA